MRYFLNLKCFKTGTGSKVDDALPQLQQEQQAISQELSEVIADFQGIYDTVNKIKADVFYQLSREGA